MEIRGNSKAELAAVEQQLAALARPVVPRSAKTCEELGAQIVPPGVWKDSNECNGIHESAYFQKACAHVVLLRRELVAAQDYERLSTRAGELREGLAEAPIVATSDPLPEAFGATLGRVLPMNGKEGVGLLLTVVVELMSAFGFAGLRSLAANSKVMENANDGTLPDVVSEPPSMTARSLPRRPEPALPIPSLPAVVLGGGRVRANATRETSNPPSNERTTLPKPSLPAVVSGGGREQAHATREILDPPSNILPMRVRPPHVDLPKSSPARRQGGPVGELVTSRSHVQKFAEECLRAVEGTSAAASDILAAYHVWCAAQGYAPISMPRFAAELKELGYVKWKSNGLMRYRNLQLMA